MRYNLKPALTVNEQVARLKEREMVVEDETEAASILQRINYYRFSGYAFLFQKPNNHYQKGTSFRKIIRIMEFDTALRQIFMSFLEYIEIYARTKIAYWFSLAHGRDGGAHYDPSLFVNADYHAEYLRHLQEQMQKNSSQPFVLHHIQSYNGKMPLWCAVELLSFSALSKLYSNMTKSDKELIAANMDTDANHLTNWLHCFSVLRNACAHYSRLYSIMYSPKVSLDGKLLRRHPEIYQDTLFSYAIAMIRIIPEKTIKARFVTSLDALFGEYADSIDIHAMGFPESWGALLLDKTINTLKPVSEEKKKISDMQHSDSTEGETT